MEYKLPGESICEAEDFIKGHGTIVKNDYLISTYFGVPKTINKLVTVVPKHFTRYNAEVGDVVIGRVVSIQNKKWKIEMLCKSEASLNLSSINLPGVTQRRKLESDEIMMREYFDIGCLLVAEVQKVNKCGSVSLHTRNEKYKKLCEGVLIQMPVSLIPQTKSKFFKYSDIEIIVGRNGYIWISPLTDDVDTCKRIYIVAEYFKEKSLAGEMPDFNEIF